MAAPKLNSAEEAQLLQTIEMFQVIVQSQPSDTQSLAILKEAYYKLDREEDLINISKRIAEAYLMQGQLSSAILEYETVLQRRPDDQDVQDALKKIEDKASNVSIEANGADSAVPVMATDTQMFSKRARVVTFTEVEDGRKAMHKIFVESKLIAEGDFDLCWRTPDNDSSPSEVNEPFIAILQDKAGFNIEKSLKLLSDKSRAAYLALERYDVDIDLSRGFSADVCRRWCVLPFDRMSKAVLVATANPFNQEAARQLAATTSSRLLWYLASPAELTANLRKAFH
jgi:tetratricopeptide (TPR) repeat protein